MENATLEFPPIDTEAKVPTTQPAAPVSKAVAVVTTIKDAALAKFSQTEVDLLALAKKYDQVAFAVATTKGLNEAKAARKEIRDARYLVQNIEKETKDELNGLKKVVQDKAAKLIAIVEPAEKNADDQIKRREQEIADEKAKEDERKQKHADAIAKIGSYVVLAQGKDFAALAKGIGYVENIAVGKEVFEEFAPAALAAKDDTLTKLRAMHAKALDDERLRAEHEQRQRTITQLAGISKQVSDCIGQPSAAIEVHVNLLADTVYSEGVDAAVLTAHENALAQLRGMLAAEKKNEEMAAELEKMRAAHTPTPVEQPAATLPPAEAERAEVEPARQVLGAFVARAAAKASPPAVEPVAPTRNDEAMQAADVTAAQEVEHEDAGKSPSVTAESITVLINHGYKAVAIANVKRLATQRDALLASVQQFITVAGSMDAAVAEDLIGLVIEAGEVIDEVFTA